MAGQLLVEQGHKVILHARDQYGRQQGYRPKRYNSALPRFGSGLLAEC
jgi:hypothetical protein